MLDWLKREFSLKRETQETSTEVSLDSQISAFWDSLRDWGFSPRLIERVWVASRCIQLNSQQIASMPLKFFGAPTATDPAWVSNPDPAWFPNGIGDAVAYIARCIYGWGDAFLLITERYSDGFPSSWTVLDPSVVNVTVDTNGRRQYKAGERPLSRLDVVQISRNPGGVRGTSALAAFASQMLGAIAGADLSRAINDNGVPSAVIKSQRKLTKQQAESIQAQWIAATAVRRGAPAVLSPDLDFEQLAFSPKDLMLLDAQEFNARVIASAFGVPPYMLNIPLTGGLTYQNPAMLGEQWWRFELRPMALRVSRALTAQMLPRGSFVEFDAHDTFQPLLEDPNAIPEDSPVASASPAQNGSGLVAELRPVALAP